MDNILLFHNTMRIADGHLEEFREAVAKAVRFVQENGAAGFIRLSEPAAC